MKILFAVAAAVLAAQQVPPNLTPEQMERLERGEAVQVLQSGTGSPWPRSTVFVLIEATPEEAAAVLFDFDLQPAYTPRLKSARILRRTGPDTDVEYVVSVPVYPDERSVSRQRVTRSGAEYRLNWHTVVDSANKGSVTSGSATFRPTTNTRTGKPMTLMIHDQAVVPASVFAKVPFVRSRAVEASRDAADAIRKQVEHEKRSDQVRLDAQLKNMRPRVVPVDSTGR